MIAAERWAAAFINVIMNGAAVDDASGDIEEGVAALKIFAAAVGAIPQVVSGGVPAAQVDRRIRAAMEQAGVRLRGAETACRFIVLMVKKDFFKFRNEVIQEIEKILDQKMEIIAVTVEAALPMEGRFEETLKAALRKKPAVREVRLTTRVVPELLAGYRLWFGNELLDASLRRQLQKMTAYLSAPPGTAAAGGFSW
jgi:F-type H+-transporting ATPase subunit delta